MPSPLDPSLIANLPAELRTAVEAQIEALAAERTARLEPLAREMKRARFGRRSEKLAPD